MCSVSIVFLSVGKGGRVRRWNENLNSQVRLKSKASCIFSMLYIVPNTLIIARKHWNRKLIRTIIWQLARFSRQIWQFANWQLYFHTTPLSNRRQNAYQFSKTQCNTWADQLESIGMALGFGTELERGWRLAVTEFFFTVAKRYMLI